MGPDVATVVHPFDGEVGSAPHVLHDQPAHSLPAPQTIPPYGTHELYVARSDSSGGSGANFVIEWSAERPINPPLVEALHADIREARTLLFVTTARPIQTR